MGKKMVFKVDQKIKNHPGLRRLENLANVILVLQIIVPLFMCSFFVYEIPPYKEHPLPEIIEGLLFFLSCVYPLIISIVLALLYHFISDAVYKTLDNSLTDIIRAKYIQKLRYRIYYGSVAVLGFYVLMGLAALVS